MPQTTKDEKYIKLSYIILSQDIQKGHLGWNVSSIAKESGFSRGWIYKYLGKDKKNILYTALKIFIDDLFYLTVSKQELLKDIGLEEAFIEAKKVTVKYPELYLFYQKYGCQNSEIGEYIRKRERKYIEDILFSRNHLKNKFQAYFFRSIIHGVGSSLFLSDDLMKKLISFCFSEHFQSYLKTVPNLIDEEYLR